ncbi:MAG: D-amino-acid transaminase [Geminicoccaceae bacterium]|nr:D-amino-acid transaminase [Geminicoccaceae bacterium]
MSRIAYVNGRYVPVGARAIAIEDRGYQFADGIYEVIRVIDGKAGDLDRHLDRLERSLRELAIEPPMSRAALCAVIGETLRRNRLRHAVVYIQISRGIAPRNHIVPASGRASLVVTVRRARLPSPHEVDAGCRVIAMPDERWHRCDIKSIGLLPNLLARTKAHREGAREAWLVDDDGFVTEGSSSNAWIVDGEGRLVTRPAGTEILGGITRSVVLELARKLGIEVVERPFTLEEAKGAREAFLTSTSSLVMPVVQIDDSIVANGVPGSITRQLQAEYSRRAGLDVLSTQQDR